jgi:hypothetical protein
MAPPKIKFTEEAQIDNHLWEELVTMFRRRERSSWAILLTCFKDDPQTLPARSSYEPLFTTAGAGTLNMIECFADMSHGLLDLGGTQVFGWHRLDQKRAEYGKTLDRNGLLNAARAKATAAGVDLTKFQGVVVVGYDSTDLCGWVGGMAALCDDHSLQPSLLGQEMGHGYGLDHARLNGSTADYTDPWDVMSTAASPWMQAADPNYTSVGPGLNAWSMRSRGWLDESRVWTAGGSYAGTVELRPLHHRHLPGHLAAEVGEYLVEFRVPEKWDAAIGPACVLVHRFSTFDNRPYLMQGTNGQMSLHEGDVFQSGPDSSILPGLKVEVADIDAAGHTARLNVSVWPGYRPPDLVATEIFGGVTVDGGGYVVINGKVLKVPPRGPVTDIVNDLVRYLETDPANGVLVTGQIRQTLARSIMSHGMRMFADVETISESPPGFEVRPAGKGRRRQNG